ncbi:NAD(P)-binding protein [Polyplosphaeria fusca]|uniref:NAD(P)-binding protein n=1 Tax=Polyplosphaeria fusca TaxID=682080 RepID=A0A9P4QW99_9PLEO|nr:NAD(P)-binding protein [Polyplosphaeria fusca]
MDAASGGQPDPDALTRPFAFMKTYHRDVYPLIDAKRPTNSAKGKSVLITGASRGIGKVLAVPCDMADVTSVETLFKRISVEIGTLHVLICNVSFTTGHISLAKKTSHDWLMEFEGNVRAAYLPIHSFLTASPNPLGTVIAISSGAAAVTFPGSSAYSMAKHATHRLVDFVHTEHPSVRAFSLALGIVMTDSVDAQFEPFAKDTPDLVGGVTVYLGTGKGEFLRGCWLSVNWDMEEVEEHRREIEQHRLLKTKLLVAHLGGPFLRILCNTEKRSSSTPASC